MTSKNRTVPSQFLKGIGFASVTTVLWGLLPILMDASLREFQSGTVVWFRFTFAFFGLFFFLLLKKKQPVSFLMKPPLLGLGAGLCLAGNYFYFLEGIRLSTPSNAAVMIQTAPVLLVIAGVLLFREKFSRPQWVGLSIAVLGFFFFFNEQSASSVEPGDYLLADGLIVLSGAVWVGYMILQKLAQKSHSNVNLNLLVYGTAALALILAADFSDFNRASGNAWILMVVLGMNTLLAYGCLTEAIKYIPLSLISVVVALNPFLTMALMRVVPDLFPEWVRPESLSSSAYIGAILAICGVVVVIRYHAND